MSQIKVGDKVEAVTARYGWGGVDKGDIGVVVCKQHDGDFVVDFPNQHGWCARPSDLKLVEEKPVFKEMKIRVKNAAHSEAIQESLFDKGYSWPSGQKVSHTSAGFLYTKASGRITWGEMEHCFKDKPFPEYKAEVKTVCIFEEVEEEKPETVELNGKTYLKADLEAALEKLTPMQKPVSVS
jgi:hypothetical protein